MDKFSFNNWIALNYAKIKERLSLQSTFDEDSLQDAYLSCVRKRGEVRYDDYPALFLKCYHEAMKKEKAHGFVYAYPDPLFFEFLREDEQEEEVKPKNTTPSAKRILQYIKIRNNAADVQIFNYYMLQGLLYSTIAAYTGCSGTAIRKKIEAIKKDVRQYFTRAI